MKVKYNIKNNDLAKKVYWFDDGSFGELEGHNYFQMSLNDSSTFLLNINRDNYSILSIEGYFPIEAKKYIKSFHFSPLHLINGELKLDCKENELDGDGCFFPLLYQNLYYDNDKDILAIGKLDNIHNVYIKFGENIYAIFENETFCGVAIELIKK